MPSNKYQVSSANQISQYNDQDPDLYAFIAFIAFIGFIGPDDINYMC